MGLVGVRSIELIGSAAVEMIDALNSILSEGIRTQDKKRTWD